MAEMLLTTTGMILFWLTMILAVLVIPVGLPGTFVIAGLALLHGVVTQFDPISVGFVVLLFGLAVAGEVVEFFFGAASAKKYGGSKWAMTGAVVGGFAGAVFGTGVVPVLGTLVGAFLGAFAGAALGELVTGSGLASSLRVGYGAMLGSIGGKLSKVLLAIVMVVMTWLRIA